MLEIIKILESIKDKDIYSYKQIGDDFIMVVSKFRENDWNAKLKFTFVDHSHNTREKIIGKINLY